MNRGVEEVLLEMVGLCEQFQLEYAIMGEIAVRVHGIPRPTFDVDFELTVDVKQLRTFFDAADQLGYSIAQPFRTGWRDEVGGMPLVKLKTFLDTNRSVDVDIFINETAFQNSVMKRRQAFKFENRLLNFVTAEDLILFKLLAHRPRDLGDVADVLFVQGQLDEPYLTQWANALGISDRLATALTQTNHQSPCTNHHSPFTIHHSPKNLELTYIRSRTTIYKCRAYHWAGFTANAA